MGDATTQTRTLAPGPDGPDTADGKRTFLGLSLSQIAGSALAAVTAAVAASFLGVAGTLIGAAFGSVVSTVAGAAYATSLKTAATRVRTTRTVVVRPGPDGVRGASQSDPARVPSGFGARPVPLARVEALRTGPDGATTYRAVRTGLLARVPWKPVAAVAALGFVLGVGLLSVTEGLLGHPVSSSASSGTTIGDVVGGSSGSTPTPVTTPSAPASTAPATTPATGTSTADATPSSPVPADGATTPADGATTTPGDPAPATTDGAATASQPAAGTTQTP